jgi:hypothetical protein
MLTQNDVTVPNALEVLEQVKGTGLRHVGCKDIGLSPDEYVELFSRMKRYGMATFLEVVSSDEKKHFDGVNLALKLGVDYLVGGMPQHTRKTLEFLKRSGMKMRYCPYVGGVTGHPCILGGSVDEIIESGREAETLGAYGVNLLLYRYSGDQKSLFNSVFRELRLPLIVAGNVRTFEQIEELRARNAWAFTIGGAIFEKRFAKEGSIQDQISAVLNRL